MARRRLIAALSSGVQVAAMPSESIHEPTATHATVYAGPNETDYAHAGRGAAVVLIGSRLNQPLFAALAVHFRVIVPEMPCRIAVPGTHAPSPPFSAWLRDFLDCLGIARVSVVAEESYALRALQFCLNDATVDRVVLLTRDATDQAVADDVVRVLLGGQDPAFTSPRRGAHAL